MLTRRVPRVATGLAREASWVTAHLIAYPFGLIGESNTKPDQRHSLGGLNLHQRSLVHYAVDAAATPILLVHGIVDNHTIFDSLERALRRRGFSDLSSFDYGLLTTDVRATALDLATAVERLVAESGYEKVHVIGHSLGGLISRYYVQRMGGHERVHTLVTLGTPHQGSALARVGSMLPLVRQLRPDSDLIAELQRARTVVRHPLPRLLLRPGSVDRPQSQCPDRARRPTRTQCAGAWRRTHVAHQRPGHRVPDRRSPGPAGRPGGVRPARSHGGRLPGRLSRRSNLAPTLRRTCVTAIVVGA